MTTGNVGIQIGGGVKPEMAEAVIRVATCSPIPDVAVKALEVFAQLTRVENVSVTGCTIGYPVSPPVVGSDFDGWAE